MRGRLHVAASTPAPPAGDPSPQPITQGRNTPQNAGGYRAESARDIGVACIDVEIGSMHPPQGAPRRRRWAGSSVHIRGDGRLGHLNPEFQQCAANAWRAPEPILSAHLANELARLRRDGRPTWPLPPLSPLHMMPKPLSPPALNGISLNDVESVRPRWPPARQEDPQPAISRVEAGPFRGAFQHVHLMPKRNELKLQIPAFTYR